MKQPSVFLQFGPSFSVTLSQGEILCNFSQVIGPIPWLLLITTFSPFISYRFGHFEGDLREE